MLCHSWILMAQEPKDDMMTIQGVIKDKDNRKTVHNANIAVVGSNIGTVSNADGAFALKVSKQELAGGLLVSHIGYQNV